MTAAERHAAFRMRAKQQTPPQHGTTYAYNVYGCRCPLCQDAMCVRNARRVWVPKPRRPRVVIARPRTAPANAPTSSWWLCDEQTFTATVAERFA